MDELTFYFSKALRNDILKSFRGYVSITGTSDDLAIFISCGEFEKTYHEKDIVYKVQHGMTAEYLSNKILKDIKNLVLKSVFKKIPA